MVFYLAADTIYQVLLLASTCSPYPRTYLTSPIITFLPELLVRPLRLLDPNSDSSTLLPRETTLYFLEPVDLADSAPDASLLASEATSAMMNIASVRHPLPVYSLADPQYKQGVGAVMCCVVGAQKIV